MNLVKLILNNKQEHNGHKQLELNGFNYKKRIKLLAKLERAEPIGTFVLETYSDGSGSILQKDYWKAGEHHLGHTDRLLASFE